MRRPLIRLPGNPGFRAHEFGMNSGSLPPTLSAGGKRRCSRLPAARRCRQTHDDRWQAVSIVTKIGTSIRFRGQHDRHLLRPSCPARRPDQRTSASSPIPLPLSKPVSGRAAAAGRSRRIVTGRARGAGDGRLDAHIEERVTLPRLAAALGVVPGIAAHVHTDHRGFPAGLRRRAAAGISQVPSRDGADVTRALHAAGYGSSSRFYSQARTSLGMTPTSYRQGGEGMTMSFATADSAWTGAGGGDSAESARSASVRTMPRSSSH